jgi:MoaA/NifB/PqqE/SkfB family radical SAM enzyme
VPLLRYAATFELIGEGEPTLNPDLPYFLSEGVRQGCYTRMFSNGTRLTPELCATLVRLRLGTLVLSVPAGRRDVYQAMVGSDLFDRLVQNVRDLQDIKRILGSPWPRLFMNCPLLAESLDSAPDLVRIAGSLGVEAISFAASCIYRREMEGESILKVDRDRVHGVFQRCTEVGRRAGIRVILPVLDDSGPVQAGADDRENRFGCLFPWQSLMVRASGDVEVCVYNRKITGNLETMTLDQIWNGREQRRFRSGETTHGGVDDCQMCYHRCYRARQLKQSCAFPFDLNMTGY